MWSSCPEGVIVVGRSDDGNDIPKGDAGCLINRRKSVQFLVKFNL